MPLTDVTVRNAKPGTTTRKLYDERGLYLEVSPKGGKWWRLKYRFNGKEKRLSLGVYPDVTLKAARDHRDDARKLLTNGIDPSENRKAQKTATQERAANSFEVIAREWFAKQSPNWAASHADKIIKRLEKNVFPWIGKLAIAEITAPELLAVLRRVENRGALDTAHRTLQNCGQVFRYAVITSRAERDPSSDLRGALPSAKHTHYPAIIEPTAVGGLMRAIDGFSGTFPVLCALRLAPLLFVRPGELRNAKWTEFDLEASEWRYFITKTKTHHLVPLATQAIEILTDLKALTGNRTHVFPGRDPKKPMSGAAVNAALRRMGFDTKTEITGHGFRAMARTMLHEKRGFAPETIEHQLAHSVPDRLGNAYNRTKFIDERRRMMQDWADYLDELKAGAQVIPITRPAVRD